MADVLTVAIGVVAGFVGAMGKSFVDRRDRIDAGLLGKRTDIYSELWRLTGILPLYPHDPTLTYRALAERSAELRDWYFAKDGGLYLSRQSQRRYLDFQEALADAVAAGASQPTAGDIVSGKDYAAARAAGSKLRSSLTDDLHSRRGWRSV